MLLWKYWITSAISISRVSFATEVQRYLQVLPLSFPAVFRSFVFPLLARLFRSSVLTESLAQAISLQQRCNGLQILYKEYAEYYQSFWYY